MKRGVADAMALLTSFHCARSHIHCSANFLALNRVIGVCLSLFHNFAIFLIVFKKSIKLMSNETFSAWGLCNKYAVMLNEIF
jgi:hypothetical protein